MKEHAELIELIEKDLSNESSKYDIRAHQSHYTGNEPSYHFESGAYWVLEELKNKLND